MLSRVAAVMAPRTHNRCRVTGSSGRRRKGRESEPQRPNMSRHLFYSAVLLLVVMMCCGSGTVTAQGDVQQSKKKFEWKDIPEGETVESLGAPGLLKVGSDVFAVAEAKNKEKEGQGSFTGIASQLLTKTVEKKDNTPVEIMNDANTKTQFLEESISADPKKKVDVSRPTTVVKGKDIYILVGKYSRTDATGEKSGANDGGLLLVKGKVSEENNKRIKWSDTNAVPQASVGEQLESWTGLIGGGGSGFEMKGDKLVFPVEGTKKKGDAQNGEKAISLLIYTSDNAASWKLSKGMSDGGCSDPSVVEWGEKDKKLIMMTACDDGRRRVYESGDMGESWTEALGTLSRVWGNRHTGHEKGVRSGFITATIDGDDKRNVMLVTLPVYAKEADKKETGNGKGKLHLWLTDNTHIVDIGPVSDDDAAASSLLYKSGKSETNNEKEELIALYEKKKKGDEKPSPGMVSVRLTAQLQRVKDVLATWKEVDDLVSKLCPSSDVESSSTGNACSTTVKITDGLVGFLSGNFSENTWRDEYLGVNATVKGNDEGKKATLHEGGVTFHGAWAEWPVGSQGENQLYHFANYDFTLVATVSIDKVPTEGNIPLLGVKMAGAGTSVVFGLLYNGGGKWKLSCGGGTDTEDQSVTLATETTHHVAIVLRNSTQGSAYVDGQRVGGDVPCALGNKDSEAVSHFYIGGDGNSAKGVSEVQDVSVTVRNVLLYNRPLDGSEIAALAKNKITNPKPEVPKTSTTSPLPPAVSGSDVQGTCMSNSAGNQPSEQGQPEREYCCRSWRRIHTSEVYRRGFFRTEAVKQPTSGTSPSGNKNVDGTPMPDADPTVTSGTFPDGGQTVNGGSTADSEPTTDTREGGTNGQEEVNSHNGEVNATALSSSLGNLPQGNNTDAGTVRGSGLLPSLPLMLGLWGFAAL
ncbi:putative trans-sialidase, Group V [Trypanosoma cruzi]|nr:putative trans-sialidase, Group V [Trypanosoma cruzi]